MYHIIKNIFSLLIAGAILTGCNLFGFELQKDYDYEHTGYNSKIGTDAYTFMQSRPDLFSDMLDAIDYVKDVDPEIVELYKRPGNTYLLLINDALTDVSSYNAWTMINKVSSPNAPNWADRLYYGTSLKQYPKQQVINLLRYHIVKGELGNATIKSTPTWYDTYASGDSSKVNIYLWPDREAYVQLNDYAGHPKLTDIERFRTPNPDDPTQPGTITWWMNGDVRREIEWVNVRPRTANLEATNGYVHVINRWLLPPTRKSLGL